MAPDDWELHKNTISCLFLLEKLSLIDVSARMKEEYNFDKKKHQYEYQLKKWGIKKNLRKDVWRYVSHEVRKRKILGKKSEITVFGMQLPPDKVRKDVQRYTTIPTAKDFGRDAPSPMNPGWDIVRIVTPSPPDFQFQWPETLPWLKFIEGVQIDLLQTPNITRLFVTPGTVSSLQAGSRNPLALYTEINDLALSIPQNHEKDDQNARASLWAGGPSAIATESLKVILFSLANKNLHNLRIFHVSSSEARDQFILWVFGCISESNFEWSIPVLGTSCSTTNAILEVVYGCAIRQKRYALISQLLKAGVDPNIPVDLPFEMYRGGSTLTLERGKMKLVGNLELSCLKLNPLEVAVELYDIRLGTILLGADANIGNCMPSLLKRIALSTEEDNHLEFFQLLLRHGVILELLPALSIAIAKRHNRLATLFVEKVHQMRDSKRLISHCFEARPLHEGDSYWYDERFQLLQIDCTLLHVAIISENTAMVEFLLRTTLACPGLVSKKALRDLFMVACLAGDHSTIEQLVNLDLDWGEYWTLGVSPLVATAWNPDIRIAEMILQCGAFSDHDIGDFPESSKSPLPIHVATRSGNTNFVQWVIGHGRGLDVQFDQPRYLMPSVWDWLVPSRLTSPLQLALESGSIATVIQCRHGRLLGGELIQAIRLGDERVVSDLLISEKNITFTDAYGDTVLEAAAEIGNRDIILLYFSSGGIYRSSAFLKAVKAALISQDNSIVFLLAMNRPIKMIDKNEASALVMAIREKQLALVIILLGDQFLPGSVYSCYDSNSCHGGYFENTTPLNAALSSGNTDLIKKILQAGYRAQPRDLVCSESTESYESTASLFWSHFPPTNSNPKWTQRLLFENVQFNRTQRVQECIACIDGLDYYIESRTPLQKAVENGYMKLIDLLFEAGADINAPAAPISGATALQLAAIKGSMNIARKLLERGVNVNAPPAKHSGRTALEGASEHGKLDMVQLLLEKGVELKGAMRIHYIRAVAYAKNQGHFALAKLLKEFGGWIERDQEVYDREDILVDNGYFVFDGETQDWYFRRVGVFSKKRSYDVDSIASWVNTIKESTTDPRDSLEDDDSEDSEYESQDGYQLDQGNNHETYMPEWETEDKELLMERYLNSHFEHNLDDFQDGNHEFHDRHVQNANDGIGDSIQEQGNDHRTYIPEREAEDVRMMMIT